MIHVRDSYEYHTSIFEFKHTNVSYGNLEQSEYNDLPNLGIIQFKNVNQDTYANTFYKNEASGSSLILEYDKRRSGTNFGIFHWCNFVENTVLQTRTLLFTYFCRLSIYECNFRDNYPTNIPLIYADQSTLTIYRLTFQSGYTTYTGGPSSISIGTIWTNSNLKSNTHYATRGFCAAEIPSYTPTKTPTPSKSQIPPTTPINSPYDTPYNTPYDTPFSTPYNTPISTPEPEISSPEQESSSPELESSSIELESSSIELESSS